MAGVFAFATFIALTSAGVVEEQEEDVLDIMLASEPEAEPEPEPEPEPEEEKKAKAPKPRLVTPVEIPDSPIAEADPTGDDQGEDDPFADAAEAPAPEPEPIAKPEPPKPKPKPVVRRKERPKGPVRVTENVTPPKVLSRPMPQYPSSARTQGIQGMVIVRYVVSEQGVVTSVRALRGPKELHETSIAAVKQWKFSPAVLDGQPVAVVQIARFPFRLDT